MGVATLGLLAAAGERVQQPGSTGGGGASQGDADRAVAQKMSFDVTTVATGELEARKQIEIRNQLEQSTTITEVVKEGTMVKQGEVLVRLNSDAIQVQVDEESLKVEAARAAATVAENNYQIQVSENASNVSKAEVAVAVADLELKKWLDGEVRSTRQANDLALDKARRELDRLKEKYELGVNLERQGYLSRDELKRDELAYLEADAALKTAELNKRVYEEYTFPKDQKVKQSDLEQAKAELERVKVKNDSELASKDADRKNKREELRIREQRLQKYRDQLAMCVLTAPSDGLVVYDSSLNRDMFRGNQPTVLDVGVQVQKNQRLMVLPDTSEMVAAVRVQESVTSRVRKGQTAAVKIDAMGGRIVPGVVDSVGVIAETGGWRDPNLREYTVRVRLTESDARMKPSMRCEATLNLERVDNALSVPIQSVFSEQQVRYVLVPLSDRTYARRPVAVGRRSDRYAEIVAGLQPGEEVLVRAPKPGELVEGPWDKDQLAAVGLRLLDDGRIERVMPPGGGGPPGMGGGPRRGPGGEPGGPGGAGGAGGAGGPGAPAGAAPGGAGEGRPARPPTK